MQQTEGQPVIRDPAEVPPPRVGVLAWLALLLRGMAMGLAELVPGVSGGTIAFVTGIYFELVKSLSSFRPSSVVLLWREGPVAFWHRHNLGFLLALAAGMLLSVLLFARLFQFLLETVPTLVWAFFFGLIAASVLHIGRGRAWRLLAGFGSAGLVGGLLLLGLEPVDSGVSLWVFFLGGALAVSAWLLPAISGSFLLLILGLYEPVLRALNTGDVPILVALALGCVAGIMSMARLLSWLMARFREPVLALLTGFMAGSLARLWPWQQDGQLLLPFDYQMVAGQPALLVYSVAAAMAGMVCLWLLSRLE